MRRNLWLKENSSSVSFSDVIWFWSPYCKWCGARVGRSSLFPGLGALVSKQVPNSTSRAILGLDVNSKMSNIWSIHIEPEVQAFCGCGLKHRTDQSSFIIWSAGSWGFNKQVVSWNRYCRNERNHLFPTSYTARDYSANPHIKSHQWRPHFKSHQWPQAEQNFVILDLSKL